MRRIAIGMEIPWHKTEYSFLKIQRQQRRFLGIEFQALFFSVFGRQAVMTFPPCA
jgi:hypothetical protein